MVVVNGMLVEKNMQGRNAMGVAAGLAMALMTTAWMRSMPMATSSEAMAPSMTTA